MIKILKRVEGTSIALLATSLISKFAYAAGNTGSSGQTQIVTLQDPLGGGESFTTVANNVANFLVVDVAIPLTVIMVLVGAFQIMTAGGDPEKFSKGRKTITYAAIGLVAAFISLGAAKLIQSFLGQ